jgi:carbonic anhydrase
MRKRERKRSLGAYSAPQGSLCEGMSVSEMAAWLRKTFDDSTGFREVVLDGYVSKFEELGVDGATLSDMDMEGLKDAGVENAVHRSKIIRAWRQQRQDLEESVNPGLNSRSASPLLFNEHLHYGFSMEDAMNLSLLQRKTASSKSPREVLGELQKGNTRFWMGLAKRPEADAFQRRALILQQYPSVCILGCSDSRVPIEIVFDQGLGDIFVIRVAGNAVGGPVTASIEYAVNHLNIKVLMVMGHEGCGAVKAAMQSEEKINLESENLRNHLKELKLEMDEARLRNVRDVRALDREAVVTNVSAQLRALTENQSVMSKVRTGKLILTGACYELSSGIVDFLNEVEVK